jgi:hypothetical protein
MCDDCPALSVATKALELANQANRRVRYGRTWTALGVAALTAAGVCLGAFINSVPRTTAELVATRVAAQVAKDTVEKARVSTEAIATQAADQGSAKALREFYASLPRASLGRTQPFVPLVVQP